jgi:hypothetical protein
MNGGGIMSLPRTFSGQALPRTAKSSHYLSGGLGGREISIFLPPLLVPLFYWTSQVWTYGKEKAPPAFTDRAFHNNNTGHVARGQCISSDELSLNDEASNLTTVAGDGEARQPPSEPDTVQKMLIERHRNDTMVLT